MKVIIKLEIPDNDCFLCQYFGHYDKYLPYKDIHIEKNFCKLFNDCELIQINGEFQRCVACQSCAEVKK